MRTKNFLIFLCIIVTVSVVLITFGQQKPVIQDIITTTHQQIRNFTKVRRVLAPLISVTRIRWFLQDTLRDAEAKTFVSDEKYLAPIGLGPNPRLYPKDTWRNTSLPVFVTYVMEGQESQAVGVINNISKLLPNNTILVYNLGLGNYGLRTVSFRTNVSIASFE